MVCITWWEIRTTARGPPANVVGSAGVQIATPGQSPSTAPTGIGSFSISALTNPTTGTPYVADKLGKDNNFRGLTISNNTLYVTKGSGGNGVNTVYQVGAAGTLPTLATAASAPITILPGLPTTLAKNADATNPFGIFFASATTLYVADEGDGTIANAATSTAAGLQKWSLANGAWKRLYVLQNGLVLGQQYSVTNYPAALNPATNSLRNITGKVNADGTVTIYAVSSTVSASGDQGADPNKLVAITDTLANTDPAIAANEKFTTIRSAGFGEVLRGVSFTPATSVLGAASGIAVFSAATNNNVALSPGSLATVYGTNFTSASPVSNQPPFPTAAGATSVNVVDLTGKSTPAPLLYVSPTQINFLVPAGTPTGATAVSVVNGGVTQSLQNIQINPVAPSLFTLNNFGLAAAGTVLVSASGAQTPGVVYTSPAPGMVIASPINLGGATDSVYLILYGTGLQSAGTTGVTVTIDGVSAPVTYAGPQKILPGLDQVDVRIPVSLAGKGNVSILLTAAGIQANPVQITIQ